MSAEQPIVWCAGVAWDEPAGTDRRLVEALAPSRQVHWIDPPRFTRRAFGPQPTEVAGVIRHRVWAPPATTRSPVIVATQLLRHSAVELVTESTGAGVVVVANPLARFPRTTAARRVLYVTDDWEAGAELMGLRRADIARSVQAARRSADVTAVVSPALAASADDIVLPNGGPVPYSGTATSREPVAVLIGQLNERLDLHWLETLTASGTPVRVVGRRVVRDRAVGRRLDAWLAHPLVDWRGAVPAGDVPALLADAAVGLTPYRDSAFNRASSPLKTFEYLAAGLPVVSSALPASRWLDTRAVAVVADADAFAAAVHRAIAVRGDRAAESERRAFAASHTWARRAEAFLQLTRARRVTGAGGMR